MCGTVTEDLADGVAWDVDGYVTVGTTIDHNGDVAGCVACVCMWL